MGDHHHKPDTTRCGCGVFYGFSRHHSGGFRRLTTLMLHQGLRHHSPTPQGAAVVAVPSSERHHDGDRQEIGIFLSSTVTVAANLPSIACHGGGNGWKSHRCCCCGGCGGGIAVVVGGGCGCYGVGNGGKGWRLVALHGDDVSSGVVMAVGVWCGEDGEGSGKVCSGCCRGGVGCHGGAGGRVVHGDVNTAYCVQNKVLLTKPHNKTPYELLLGRKPSIRFMRPFGCPVTILNTLDTLGKFDGKTDEGFLVGYSVNSKAFRVFNNRTRIVQETLHINFLENQPNVARSGPKWLFNIDTLTQSMNYQTIVAGNQPNHNAGIQGNFDVGKVVKETVSAQQYVLLPLWSTSSKDPQNTDADVAFDVKDNANEVYVSPSSSDKPKKHDEKAKREAKGKSPVDLC
nr:retrovirus-related Pol polyprotein from transposon TNT 1-94 [Tanacetum cinerariifolium]